MSNPKQKLILVGNGMSGIRFLEQLTQEQSGRYDISVFGGEPHGGYNRILLSPLLSGEQSFEDVVTHPVEWYKDNDINFHSGKAITSIDRQNKNVSDCEGKSYAYDRLVIATGSNPFIPPIDGHDLAGVLSYRTLEDVDNMLKLCNEKANAVVIGGGLLGLEAAYGLQSRGMNVTVLHAHAVLMEKQLDEIASGNLIAALENRGIRIRRQAVTQQLIGSNRVESVQLNDGTTIPADLVVFAVGIRPNIALAQSAGLECERGILVDDQLRTSDAHILAIGECVQHRNISYGLVAPLYEQADICVQYLCGNRAAIYSGSITATGLKVTGVSLFSSGQFVEDDDCQVIRLSDDAQGIYRKLVIKHNCLVGVLLYGDITASLWYQQLIQSKQDISSFQDCIMFGPDYLAEDICLQYTADAA